MVLIATEFEMKLTTQISIWLTPMTGLPKHFTTFSTSTFQLACSDAIASPRLVANKAKVMVVYINRTMDFTHTHRTHLQYVPMQKEIKQQTYVLFWKRG